MNETKTFPITIEGTYFHLLIFGIEYTKKMIKPLNLILKKSLTFHIFNKSWTLTWLKK